MKMRKRKLLLTFLIIAAMASVATIGTFSAFSSSVTNSGNSFAAGTVYISDNDAGSAMYNVSNKKPNDSISSCIKLTYTGTLAATVKLYTTSTIGALGPYVTLTIDKGTQASPSFPSCSGFVADSGGPLYSGSLSNFASTYSSFSNGLSAFPSSQTAWNQNDTLIYRFTLTQQDNNNANGGASGPLSTGSHSFTWEAQNQ
jgi:predicted ribosomally synthesized peptide with SipW-like signal peptide